MTESDAKLKPSGQTTKTPCPICGEAMTKLSSRSKQIKAKHLVNAQAQAAAQ